MAQAVDIPKIGYRALTSRSGRKDQRCVPPPFVLEWARPKHFLVRRINPARVRSPLVCKVRRTAFLKLDLCVDPLAVETAARWFESRNCVRDTPQEPTYSWASTGCRVGTFFLRFARDTPRRKSR